MNFLQALHHLFNPHCPDCRADRREQLERSEHDGQCKSCETLTRQLEIANHEKQELLDKLLKEPEKEVPRELPTEYSKPKQIPWNLRKQMLESEDRRAAQLRKEAARPDITSAIKQSDIKDLEIELGVDDGTENKNTESKAAER